MGHVVMPRKHFTTTKTGIVIGCAHIHKPSYEVDSDMTLVQDRLLHDRPPSPWPWVLGYIGLVCFAGALFAFSVYCGHQISLLLGR